MPELIPSCIALAATLACLTAAAVAATDGNYVLRLSSTAMKYHLSVNGMPLDDAGSDGTQTRSVVLNPYVTKGSNDIVIVVEPQTNKGAAIDNRLSAVVEHVNAAQQSEKVTGAEVENVPASATNDLKTRLTLHVELADAPDLDLPWRKPLPEAFGDDDRAAIVGLAMRFADAYAAFDLDQIAHSCDCRASD